jgi:hypothetical protein
MNVFLFASEQPVTRRRDDIAKGQQPQQTAQHSSRQRLGLRNSRQTANTT